MLQCEIQRYLLGTYPHTQPTRTLRLWHAIKQPTRRSQTLSKMGSNISNGSLKSAGSKVCIGRIVSIVLPPRLLAWSFHTYIFLRVFGRRQVARHVPLTANGHIQYFPIYLSHRAETYSLASTIDSYSVQSSIPCQALPLHQT